MHTNSDILKQLDEAVYISQEEYKLHTNEVPVVMKENGSNLVDYYYLEKLSESYGESISDTVTSILESNSLNDIKISISEEKAIVLGESFDSSIMVIKPISENSESAFWTDYVSESYMNGEIDEDSMIEAVLEEVEDVERLWLKHTNKNNKNLSNKISAIHTAYTNTTDRNNRHLNNPENELDDVKYSMNKHKSSRDFELRVANIENILKQFRTDRAAERLQKYKNKKALKLDPNAELVDITKFRGEPKSVIGRAVVKLRRLYVNFMQRAQASEDTGIAAKLKKVAAKILSYIDKLLGLIQSASR